MQVLVFMLLAALPALLKLFGCASQVAALASPAVAVVIVIFGSALFPRFASHSRLRQALVVIAGFGGLIYAMPVLFFSLALPMPWDATAQVLLPHLLLCLLCIFCIGWLHRSEISHPRSNPVMAAELGEDREFLRSLSRYCQALKEHLDRYDNEVNWSDRELTPLQAEVQSEDHGRIHGSVAVDLVEAVRRDQKADVFLVLGDPGSGKSVSLRRLVRELCQQAPKCGVVPVYVNLREFPPGKEPNTARLLEFMRTSAFNQTGRDGRAFLDRWYEPFRLGGRLFFVIDSFDELPAVLDSDDKSESHRRISTVFNQFFSQEVQGCRAVLASRLFRSPADFQGARLVIRPFSERQLLSAMGTWLTGRGIDSKAYVQRIFRERPQLVPALRNPFSAELISDFALGVAGERVPNSLFAVFDTYVTKRLGGDDDLLRRFDINTTAVRHGAGLVAEYMYRDTRIGLEATVVEIKAILMPQFGENAQAILDVLVDAKISRLGGKDRHLFSFVHRRFAEFFVVDLMLQKGLPLKVESIPEDSRWRDCLVMYCGVAPRADCVRVANYCWTVIDHHRDALERGRIAEARAAVHAIRFMADAFRDNSDVLHDSRDELGRLVLKLLRSDDILVAKIGAELIPLVPDEEQQHALVLAFSNESVWICETALNGCRHLARVSHATNEAVRRYLRALPTVILFARFQELNFSLALSDAFRFQLRHLRLDLAEAVLLFGVGLVLCLLKPMLFLPIALFVPVMSVLFAGEVRKLARNRSDRQSTAQVNRSIEGARRQIRRFNVWIFDRLLPADPLKATLRCVATSPVLLLPGLLALNGIETIQLCQQTKKCGSVYEFMVQFLPVLSTPIVHESSAAVLIPTYVVSLGAVGALIAGVGLDGMVYFGRVIAPAFSGAFWLREWLSLVGKFGRLIAMLTAVFLYMLAASGFVSGILYLARIYLPEWLRDGLVTAITAVGGLALAGYAIKQTCILAREQINTVRDRRAIARTGVPAVITCAETHEQLRNLRSVNGRHFFLDLLLYRQVKLAGAYLPSLTAQQDFDVGTRERLSKLQEQWENLGR